jgi:FkbM family methyltransferase
MLSSNTFARRFVPRNVRNWLRTPSKSLRYLADRIAFACGSLSVVNITEEWSLRCHPASRAHFEVFHSDPLQAKELAAFLASTSRGMQLLDIGAHHGFFSLAALQAGGPDARVLSVEASTRAAEILKINLRANGATKQVRVINAALGDVDGQLQMLTTGPAGADYLIIPTEARSDTIPVSVRSMPSLLRETGFKPTHIKLDIEGCEFEVIEAAADLLSELKPVIYLELHGSLLRARGKDPALVISKLLDAGYRYFGCDGEPGDLRFIADRHFDCRLVCVQ